MLYGKFQFLLNAIDFFQGNRKVLSLANLQIILRSH